MRRNLGIIVAVAAWALFAIAPVLAVAQGAPTVSLDDQLKAQYTMVKMGADSSGPAVVEAGTILAIQKGGILGVPYGDVTLAPTKYQDGTMHTPNNLMMKGLGSMFKKANLKQEQTTRLFQVGEKVYPSRIAVDVPKDKVTMDIIACDACNNVNPTTFYKSEVVFQFAKGYLATASVPQVEDTIAQVFTIDNGDDSQQSGNNAQGGNQQGGGQQEQQQQQPQAEPQTIQLGQSIDDVQNALGKPEKIVNLGAKQIYVYKDLKITFVKGKVTDVQ
ncbi:MAG: hypothetical protein LAO03_05490 [Acidobacteriia bacterium]|nr:hypothetical protein [Terriglobia bacterium]